MSRSSIIFTTSFAASFALGVAACGDDTSTGTGGGSSSSATTTATTGGSPTSSSSSSSSSTSSSSDGGGTSDGGGGSGEGGSGGTGGTGDGGSNVGGGGVGGASFEEICEGQNERFLDYADTLGCELQFESPCELPEGCEEETIAFFECYEEFLGIDDCACLFDAEDGVEYLLCPVTECFDEDDALFACLDR